MTGKNEGKNVYYCEVDERLEMLVWETWNRRAPLCFEITGNDIWESFWLLILYEGVK